MLHSIILFAAARALLFAAAHDVAVRTVPNRMSLIVATAGLGLNTLDEHFVSALFSGAMVFAATWHCWKRGWIGGGDVKLLTACALLVPPASVPELVLSTAIAGGLLALFYMALARLPSGGVSEVRRSRPAGLVRRVWHAERRRIRRGLSLPYACAIGAGVALTFCSPVPFG